MPRGYTQRWIRLGKSRRWIRKRRGRELYLLGTSWLTESATNRRKAGKGSGSGFYSCHLEKMEGETEPRYGKDAHREEYRAKNAQDAQKKCLRIADKFDKKR